MKRYGSNVVRIAPRTDNRVQLLIKLVRELNEKGYIMHVASTFRHACQSRPEVPHNQFFMLRTARASEIRRVGLKPKESNLRSVFDELVTRLDESWPEEIANFRLIRSCEDSSKITVCNMHGQIGDTREEHFFRPRSKTTFKIHCWNAGGCSFYGPQKALEPFIDHCLSVGAASPLPEDNRWWN